MRNVIYLVIIWLTLFTLNVSGQVSIGLLGGVNIADLKAEAELIESTSLLGIGGIVEYNFTKDFSIIIEPMYLQKGGMQPESDLDPEIRIKLSYFELPLFLKYKFDFSDTFKPYLIAGPTAGYRFSAELKAEINRTAFSADLKNVSKAFDFGVSMGAGFEIPLEGIFIVLEGRYTLGLIDIHKNGTFVVQGGGTTRQDSFGDDDWFKTRGIQLVCGFKFPVGN